MLLPPDRFLIPLVHLSSRPSTLPPSHSAPALSGLHFSSGAKNKPLFHHYNYLLVNNSLFLSLSSLFPQRVSSSHMTSSPHTTSPIPYHLPKDFAPTVPPAKSVPLSLLEHPGLHLQTFSLRPPLPSSQLVSLQSFRANF